MTEEGTNPDDWDFAEMIGEAEELDRSPFYQALDNMDNELIELTERHQLQQEILIAEFYAAMGLIMDKYKHAIDQDMKQSAPWLLDKFQQGEDNDNK
tara:strand:+ start:128 stop:418 length:291 start_codon:yes stop_codon:yes gene_type:complete